MALIFHNWNNKLVDYKESVTHSTRENIYYLSRNVRGYLTSHWPFHLLLLLHLHPLHFKAAKALQVVRFPGDEGCEMDKLLLKEQISNQEFWLLALSNQNNTVDNEVGIQMATLRVKVRVIVTFCLHISSFIPWGRAADMLSLGIIGWSTPHSNRTYWVPRRKSDLAGDQTHNQSSNDGRAQCSLMQQRT